MDFKEHTTPAKLEYYSFWWSEIRLVVAALALILGGVPPVLYFLPVPALYGILSLGLKLSWIVSGVASGYLAYRWYSGGRKLFGQNETKDLIAFLVSVISGLNLGLVGITGNNVGMSLLSNYVVFVATALMYLASAYYLYSRWKTAGQRLF